MVVGYWFERINLLVGAGFNPARTEQAASDAGLLESVDLALIYITSCLRKIYQIQDLRHQDTKTRSFSDLSTI